jgi:hypothetical protein
MGIIAGRIRLPNGIDVRGLGIAEPWVLEVA